MRKGKRDKIINELYTSLKENDRRKAHELLNKHHKAIEKHSPFHIFFVAAIPEYPELTLGQFVVEHNLQDFFKEIWQNSGMVGACSFEPMIPEVFFRNINQSLFDLIIELYVLSMGKRKTDAPEANSFVDLLKTVCKNHLKIETEELEILLANTVLRASNPRFINPVLRKTKNNLSEPEIPKFYQHLFLHFENRHLKDDLSSLSNDSLFIWILNNLVKFQPTQKHVYNCLFLENGEKGDFISYCRKNPLDFKKHLAIAHLLKQEKYDPDAKIDADDYSIKQSTTEPTSETLKPELNESNNEQVHCFNLICHHSSRTVLLTSESRVLKINVDTPSIEIKKVGQAISINLVDSGCEFHIGSSEITERDSQILFETITQWQHDMLEADNRCSDYPKIKESAN